MSMRPHVVFYDDGCRLCDAEIEHYKKLNAVQHINWLGIHAQWDEVKKYGFSKQNLLRRIHAVDNSGKVLSGAAVFVLIWESLQYYRWLGRFVSIFHLVPILDFFYNYFAAWRYKKNQHCKVK